LFAYYDQRKRYFLLQSFAFPSLKVEGLKSTLMNPSEAEVDEAVEAVEVAEAAEAVEAAEAAEVVEAAEVAEVAEAVEAADAVEIAEAAEGAYWERNDAQMRLSLVKERLILEDHRCQNQVQDASSSPEVKLLSLYFVVWLL
jgi:hypothetical protein